MPRTKAPIGARSDCHRAPEIRMLGLNALILARIQFGFTASFHIIFPAITIGLASSKGKMTGAANSRMWLC